MESKEETSPGTYSIRPLFKQKFSSTAVKECLKNILIEELGDKTYTAEEAPVWCKTLTEIIQNKVKELGFERYKFIVQVLLGEQKGGGVKKVIDDGYISIIQDMYRRVETTSVKAGYGTTDRFRIEVERGVSRCLWDADTDSYTSEVFCTESMFCLVAVFGVYYY